MKPNQIALKQTRTKQNLHYLGEALECFPCMVYVSILDFKKPSSLFDRLLKHCSFFGFCSLKYTFFRAALSIAADVAYSVCFMALFEALISYLRHIPWAGIA